MSTLRKWILHKDENKTKFYKFMKSFGEDNGNLDFHKVIHEDLKFFTELTFYYLERNKEAGYVTELDEYLNFLGDNHCFGNNSLEISLEERDISSLGIDLSGMDTSGIDASKITGGSSFLQKNKKIDIKAKYIITSVYQKDVKTTKIYKNMQPQLLAEIMKEYVNFFPVDAFDFSSIWDNQKQQNLYKALTSPDLKDQVTHTKLAKEMGLLDSFASKIQEDSRVKLSDVYTNNLDRIGSSAGGWDIFTFTGGISYMEQKVDFVELLEKQATSLKNPKYKELFQLQIEETKKAYERQNEELKKKDF